MKSTIKNSRILFAIIIVAVALATAKSTDANAIEDYLLDEYAANGVMFYDALSGCKSSGTVTGACGSTAREVYMSILSQHFNTVPAAAILGNSASEGGLDPASWEIAWKGEDGTQYGNITCSMDFIYSWDTLYNDSDSGTHGGVGSLGITSNLSKYLRGVNEAAPDLMEYFKNPKEYSFNSCNRLDGDYDTYGDMLIAKIGLEDYKRLVELEVDFMYNTLLNHWDFDLEKFKNMTSPSEAGKYFALKYERCKDCYEGNPHVEQRGKNAEEEYEKMKDFSCSSAPTIKTVSKTTSKTSSSDKTITLIGDSISMGASQKLEAAFPGSFMTKVGSRSSSGGGDCTGDKGAISILESIVSGNGTIKDQYPDYSKGTTICKDLSIDGTSLSNNIVWEIGTNDGGNVSDTNLNKIIDLVDGRNLFLVTPYIRDNQEATDKIDEQYKKAAEEHSNVYIVDWAALAKADSAGEYFGAGSDKGDGIHPNAKGQDVLVQAIADVVNGSGGCATYDGDYPEYLQCDSTKPWSGETYKNDKFCAQGCGPTSMAMLSTVAAGEDIFPEDIKAITSAKGYYTDTSGSGMYDLDKMVGEKYGFEVELLNVAPDKDKSTAEKVREYLEQGYMLHYSGQGVAPLFSDCGHYVGIFGLDADGKALLADSGGGNQALPVETAVNGINATQISGIKKKGGSSGGPCSSTKECKDKGGSGNGALVKGGLTKEQAQKLADYYNSDQKVPYSDFIPAAGTKYNCVSFTIFFLQYFTEIGHLNYEMSVGDGGVVVTSLKSGVSNSEGKTVKFDTGTDVKPFSVFSVYNGYSASGHTGIVVGVTDEGKILTVEASYMDSNAKVIERDSSYFQGGNVPPNGNVLAYTDNRGFKADELAKIVGN